ncbi:hypothetical protein H257_07442 [Aphanomyces astaci]|uniref:Uncharacterized protein n=1 Tax=Aphanomyces astaci TaxID=112090 RepID=W4GI84_APHAT|nr:hypothetical protein H257_07442 [Aphanomyces astaci]ETV79430.1 hypothetical protein H257_07442 [Aphanomyces astaci]|eukprot:XP_009831271.1 hypothetical protein H257_07442 [Aphanomyces astaci]
MREMRGAGVARSERRIELVQSVLHAQIVQQGVNRGMSANAATAEAGGTLPRSLSSFQRVKSSFPSLVVPEFTPITTLTNPSVQMQPSSRATMPHDAPLPDHLHGPLFMHLSQSWKGRDLVAPDDTTVPAVRILPPPRLHLPSRIV